MSMNEMREAIIVAYALPDGCKIERTGQESWAVRDRFGQCLGPYGWEYEPLATSRDSEFLRRCRYPSAHDAYDAWSKMRYRIN